MQNNTGVTSLLPNGKAGIGSGVVTAGTKYPYILITHVATDMERTGGYNESYSTSRMFVKVFAVDVPGTPAKKTINAIHKAVIACLDKDGSVSISGRKVDRPVYCRTKGTRSQLVSDTQVIHWSDTVWDMFSVPAQ